VAITGPVDGAVAAPPVPVNPDMGAAAAVFPGQEGGDDDANMGTAGDGAAGGDDDGPVNAVAALLQDPQGVDGDAPVDAVGALLQDPQDADAAAGAGAGAGEGAPAPQPNAPVLLAAPAGGKSRKSRSDRKQEILAASGKVFRLDYSSLTIGPLDAERLAGFYKGRVTPEELRSALTAVIQLMADPRPRSKPTSNKVATDDEKKRDPAIIKLEDILEKLEKSKPEDVISEVDKKHWIQMINTLFPSSYNEVALMRDKAKSTAQALIIELRDPMAEAFVDKGDNAKDFNFKPDTLPTKLEYKDLPAGNRDHKTYKTKVEVLKEKCKNPQFVEDYWNPWLEANKVFEAESQKFWAPVRTNAHMINKVRALLAYFRAQGPK
jgi:hypothetical protein